MVLSYVSLYYTTGLYKSLDYQPIDNVPEDEVENYDENKLQADSAESNNN